MHRLAGLIVVGLALPVAAHAQDWFQHPFGELRAYHKDWLAVCADDGAGACRAVQTAADPGSDAVFDRRAALHANADGSWSVEIMDRGMPSGELVSLWFEFDGERVDIPAGGWKAGALDADNVAETVVITDQALGDNLVARMQAGRRLTVHYDTASAGSGDAAFSLRGTTAATQAITARLLARQQ